jgi:hypothetical protein
MPPRFLLRLQLPVPLQLAPLQLGPPKELLNQKFLVDLRDEVLQPLEQLRFREPVP